MIVGLYADLHSNFPAMEAMFAAVSGRVDRWLCAGDSVGLFPQVNEVLDLQRQQNVTAIRGDHEKFLLSGASMEYSYTGNQALIVQREQISKENREYISSLNDAESLEIDGLYIYLTHGLNKDDEGKYIIKQNELDARYSGFDFVLFGHTHLVTVLYGRSVIGLNPGSAGFPIDAGRRPSILLLDTHRRTFEFVRFDMDTSVLSAKVREAGYNPKLIDYLDNHFQWK